MRWTTQPRGCGRGIDAGEHASPRPAVHLPGKARAGAGGRDKRIPRHPRSPVACACVRTLSRPLRTGSRRHARPSSSAWLPRAYRVAFSCPAAHPGCSASDAAGSSACVAAGRGRIRAHVTATGWTRNHPWPRRVCPDWRSRRHGDRGGPHGLGPWHRLSTGAATRRLSRLRTGRRHRHRRHPATRQRCGGWRGRQFYPRAEWPSNTGAVPAEVEGWEGVTATCGEWARHVQQAVPELSIHELSRQLTDIAPR
jgi:hypothetical protein